MEVRDSWTYFSVLKEAKKIDVEGVVSTMLPAGPEVLNSGNNDDIIVMGKMVGINVNNTGNRMECPSFLSSQGS